MRLDQAGEPDSMASLLARFGDTCPWLDAELEELQRWEDADETVSVRLYPAGLSTDEPVEIDGGLYVVLVDGDLTTPDYIRFSTDDYVPGLVAVTGDLVASTLLFELGARIVVQGSAVITGACFGRWGTQDALLAVDGELTTPLLWLDSNTPVQCERGIRALITAGRGWWKPLEPDIEPGAEEKYFQRDVLSDSGHLDVDRAFAAARQGSPLLLPGVAESFPARLEPRRAVSGYQLE